MRIILFLLSVIAALYGFFILTIAKSAIHEIEAFIVLAIAAVLFAGAGIVDAITALRGDFAKAKDLRVSGVAPALE